LLSFSNTFLPDDSIETFVIISESIENILSLDFGSDNTECLLLSTMKDLDLIKKAVYLLKVSSENCVSTEFLLQTNNDGLFMKRFIIALLPKLVNCARHNTPSRSHAIASFVKNIKAKNNTMFYILPTFREHALAQACAVARQFPLYSAKSGFTAPANIPIVIHFDAIQPSDEKLIFDIQHTIEFIRTAQRLVDTPPNVLHTNSYIVECQAIAQKIGCEITVIQGKDLEAGGFGGIWGVGKASDNLPALVILSYFPTEKNNEEQKSICLVGKGIVYDTGGLSIKTPTTSMAGMKTDMGGSAAVLGAFSTLVTTRNTSVPIHALLCLAENSVGPLATRPDDIHILLSGKSVEVNNTDAEGRLVLADGCFYAYKYLNPQYIIDIATLTGAQLIATGKNHAAIYCNDDELEAAALKAGKYTGDLTFPIPYCPEFYRNEFRSVVCIFYSFLITNKNYTFSYNKS
jgi:probable aminopeptidase NPEPL1